ncbi:hypothetical protein LSH36_126g04000, partial [Paralvinella palmiformis]
MAVATGLYRVTSSRRVGGGEPPLPKKRTSHTHAQKASLRNCY